MSLKGVHWRKCRLRETRGHLRGAIHRLRGCHRLKVKERIEGKSLKIKEFKQFYSKTPKTIKINKNKQSVERNVSAHKK
jgi:hypothetical protein